MENVLSFIVVRSLSRFKSKVARQADVAEQRKLGSRNMFKSKDEFYLLTESRTVEQRLKLKTTRTQPS